MPRTHLVAYTDRRMQLHGHGHFSVAIWDQPLVAKTSVATHSGLPLVRGQTSTNLCTQHQLHAVFVRPTTRLDPVSTFGVVDPPMDERQPFSHPYQQ